MAPLALKVIPRLQGFSGAIPWPFVQHYKIATNIVRAVLCVSSASLGSTSLYNCSVLQFTDCCRYEARSKCEMVHEVIMNFVSRVGLLHAFVCMCVYVCSRVYTVQMMLVMMIAMLFHAMLFNCWGSKTTAKDAERRAKWSLHARSRVSVELDGLGLTKALCDVFSIIHTTETKLRAPPLQ